MDLDSRQQCQHRLLLRWAFLALLISTSAVVQFILLRATIASLQSSSTTTLDHSLFIPPLPSSSVTNDGLVWVTPKPRTERRMGYEDEWLMDWKRRHYSPNEKPHCRKTNLTPYDDGVLCTMPAYIPSRLYQPNENAKYPISRVIFVTWLERRLGRAVYTSLMTLIHHNPEYEFILFNDDDIDHFLCEVPSLRDSFAIPIFSKVRSGAMRSDVWRLLVMQQYGGVYVDADISALGKLPIQEGDTLVSGVAGWSHLTTDVAGAFEHWAMAYMPHHPFVDEAVGVMRQNLEDPEYLLRDDTPEADAEDSWTIRITGPAMYQYTLHRALEKAGCATIDNSYQTALFEPREHCDDMKVFHSYFPKGLHLYRNINFDSSLTHKVFFPSGPWEKETGDFLPNDDYDAVGLRDKADPEFCDATAFGARAIEREMFWEDRVLDEVV